MESTLLSKSFVNKAQKAGKQIYVWTVNSEERLEKVVGMGIDNVITDDPVMAKELIYEQEHSTTFLSEAAVSHICPRTCCVLVRRHLFFCDAVCVLAEQKIGRASCRERV